MPKETTKRSAKGEKKKTGPKRSLSAYMFFSQANRQTVKDENPDASFGKETTRFWRDHVHLMAVVVVGTIGKILGEKWKNMTDDEKKVINAHIWFHHDWFMDILYSQPYVAKAEEDKKRYEAEKAVSKTWLDDASFRELSYWSVTCIGCWKEWISASFVFCLTE